MSIVAIKRQYRSGITLQSMSILKAFIIIYAYKFYFRHYSLCYKHMPEDHYLKIPTCNTLFCSNLVFRDLYVCSHALSKKKEKMKMYVTRNLDEFVYVWKRHAHTFVNTYILIEVFSHRLHRHLTLTRSISGCLKYIIPFICFL
jgi:hypothetical protein